MSAFLAAIPAIFATAAKVVGTVVSVIGTVAKTVGSVVLTAGKALGAGLSALGGIGTKLGLSSTMSGILGSAAKGALTGGVLGLATGQGFLSGMKTGAIAGAGMGLLGGATNGLSGFDPQPPSAPPMNDITVNNGNPNGFSNGFGAAAQGNMPQIASLAMPGTSGASAGGYAPTAESGGGFGGVFGDKTIMGNMLNGLGQGWAQKSQLDYLEETRQKEIKRQQDTYRNGNLVQAGDYSSVNSLPRATPSAIANQRLTYNPALGRVVAQ